MKDAHEIARKIQVAFQSNDVDAFRSLIIAHPEFLRHPDGTDRWMWQAAMKGDLPFIKAIYELGVDVNESKDRYDPEDPFSQVEGAILWAASEGHVDAVKWLLAYGAKINYSVNGSSRCLPLQFAATNGHLNVVTLLVENGADWRASWNGLDAISQAKDFGHSDVFEYLLALSKPGSA